MNRIPASWLNWCQGLIKNMSMGGVCGGGWGVRIGIYPNCRSARREREEEDIDIVATTSLLTTVCQKIGVIP